MMNKENIRNLVTQRKGISNLKHNELMAAYQAITGQPMRTNCGECGKRKAIRKVAEFLKTN